MSRIKLNLKHIDPVKYGIITGLLMAIISLIIVISIFLFISVAGSQAENAGMPAMFTGVFLLFIPVIYGIFGFIIGLISTALMNFVLKKTNGLDLEFETGADVEITTQTKNKVQF